MGDCTHPRSQVYEDEGLTKCGACGDVWDERTGMFRPTLRPAPGDTTGLPVNKPRVIVVDVRNGPVRKDGSNIDLPPEGQKSALTSIETADVLVEVHMDGIWVKQGVDRGWVTMFTTKSERQMSAEKAERDKDNRTNSLYDDLKVGEHPVETKFRRVWDETWETESKPLKGY